jgi:hypothetical protein
MTAPRRFLISATVPVLVNLVVTARGGASWRPSSVAADRSQAARATWLRAMGRLVILGTLRRWEQVSVLFGVSRAVWMGDCSSSAFACPRRLVSRVNL